MHLTEASFYYGEFEYMLSKAVDWSGDWATPWGSANRGTKAKTITSCDNAFVTNIGAAAASLSRKKHLLARDPGASNASEAAHRTPPGSFALCESEATATTTTKRPVGTEINPSIYRKAIAEYEILISLT